MLVLVFQDGTVLRRLTGLSSPVVGGPPPPVMSTARRIYPRPGTCTLADILRLLGFPLADRYLTPHA